MPDRAARSSSPHHVDGPDHRSVGITELIGACGVATLTVAAFAGVVPFAAAIALGLLVPAGVVDVHEHRLPDVWLATAGVGLVAAIPITIALGGSIHLRDVAVGAITMCAPIALLHLVSPAAMGFGDVKLSIVLGAALGMVDWRLTLVALAIAGLLGAGYGLAARRRTVAFGPFLLFGALITLLAGDPIVSRFLDAASTS